MGIHEIAKSHRKPGKPEAAPMKQIHRWGCVSSELPGGESLLSGYCFLASKFYSSEEVDMSLGKHKLPKLTQEEINNLSNPLSSVEIRFGGENTSL